MNDLVHFEQVRGDVDHMSRITCALEAYGEILNGGQLDCNGVIARAINLGLESIDPSINIKEGSYITLRMVKEGLVKVAKATREALRLLFELLNNLYVKFTGSLGRVRGHHKNVSRRLGKLGNRTTYKPLTITGINRLSVNGSFVGDKAEHLKQIRNVADYLLNQHPKMVTRVARVCSRRFIDLVEEHPQANKAEVALVGMEVYSALMEQHMVPLSGAVKAKAEELPSGFQKSSMSRSAVLPGNWALIYTDFEGVQQRAPVPSSSYAAIIKQAFTINFTELPLNTADRTPREITAPPIRVLSELLSGISTILEIAEKAEAGRRDFTSVKTVVDDAIRQVMDVDEGNGVVNHAIVQMLGAVSETLAAPMGNFTHWLAVTMNVYLNFIEHCVKHYEIEGV